MKVRIPIILMSLGGKGGASGQRPDLSAKNPSFTGNIHCSISLMNSDKQCKKHEIFEY